jgi:hypothetical protein
MSSATAPRPRQLRRRLAMALNVRGLRASSTAVLHYLVLSEDGPVGYASPSLLDICSGTDLTPTEAKSCLRELRDRGLIVTEIEIREDEEVV